MFVTSGSTGGIGSELGSTSPQFKKGSHSQFAAFASLNLTSMYNKPRKTSVVILRPWPYLHCVTKYLVKTAMGAEVKKLGKRGY